MGVSERRSTRPVHRHADSYVEHVGEATCACLLAMVQGNVLLLGLSHWAIAIQTGLLAGTATIVAVVLARVDRPWVVSTVLGLITTVVDYLVHPGAFGPILLEAVVTGLGAAALCFGVQRLLRRRRASRRPS